MNELLQQLRQREKRLKSYGYDIRESRRDVFRTARLEPGTVLEVGTGKGYFTAELARHRFTVVSIDIDRKEQKAARDYLRLLGLLRNVTFKIINAEQLPFREGFFDSVISVNVVHHLREPRATLKEMIRVTGRRLVIADVNKRGARILERVHAGQGSVHPKTRMDLRDVKQFLLGHGMRVKVYRLRCQTVLVAQKD